ncbi:hypothetical protein Pelo_18662 [Pelomyxa schiedti]|nr:hypothetical protein Pelo_18662 [Pelomyxa schiedti]
MPRVNKVQPEQPNESGPEPCNDLVPSRSSSSASSTVNAVVIAPSVIAKEREAEMCEDDASMREARRISGGINGGKKASWSCSPSIPFSVVLILTSIVLVATPSSIVWATSYQKADSSIDAITETLVESLSKNVHDIVEDIVKEADANLAAEVQWVRFRNIDMNSYPQWASTLRPRYVHFTVTSLIAAISLRSPNITLICTGRFGATSATCGRKTNATDGLTYYEVDAVTNKEVRKSNQGASATYPSYAKLVTDGVYQDMLRGVPNWGKVVTVQNPSVAISSYHPYMSSSGELLGVVVGTRTVQSLSEDLVEIAAGKNMIYVTTQDGYLLGASNGSVISVNESSTSESTYSFLQTN